MRVTDVTSVPHPGPLLEESAMMAHNPQWAARLRAQRLSRRMPRKKASHPRAQELALLRQFNADATMDLLQPRWLPDGIDIDTLRHFNAQWADAASGCGCGAACGAAGDCGCGSECDGNMRAALAGSCIGGTGPLREKKKLHLISLISESARSSHAFRYLLQSVIESSRALDTAVRVPGSSAVHNDWTAVENSTPALTRTVHAGAGIVGPGASSCSPIDILFDALVYCNAELAEEMSSQYPGIEYENYNYVLDAYVAADCSIIDANCAHLDVSGADEWPDWESIEKWLRDRWNRPTGPVDWDWDKLKAEAEKKIEELRDAVWNYTSSDPYCTESPVPLSSTATCESESGQQGCWYRYTQPLPCTDREVCLPGGTAGSQGCGGAIEPQP